MSQDKRTIAIKISPANDLRLVAFSGREEMSRLFSYSLSMVSSKETIEAKDIVGKQATVSILLADGKTKRYISGFINRFSVDFADEGGTTYQAELVPQIWFLTQTSDCRIFQEMTVPEIIAKILDDQGITNVDPGGLKADYRKLEYSVQFRETDFNFISRLMEQEGIFYYFKHEDGKDTLMLCDSVDAYHDLPENKVAFPTHKLSSQVKEDHVNDWRHDYEFTSGKWAQTDYNFKTPSTNLMKQETTLVPIPDAKKYELYDYPGEYIDSGEGKQQTKTRIEEEEVAFDQASGASTCRTFCVAGKFQFDKLIPPGEKGKTYTIVSISHQAREAGGYASGGESGGTEYSNSFSCISASVPFRTARLTPKPVAAIQSAVVTGPKGEEIYCDEYGRVKVQFHWDREVDNSKMAGLSTEKRKRDDSSCWIRTSHSVAGKKWGFMAIPRIGQEVIVDFLNGDPDRPIIIGSVYNQEQMPHYKLPDEKTKTYIKTSSSKDGKGHNELMFEDKADEERVYVHAQKDMDVRVRNDSKTRIYGNRHQIIGWEKDGEKGGDQREMVYQDKHLNIKRNQSEHIEGNMQLQVGGGEADNGGKMDIVIEKDRAEKVGGDSHLVVEGSHAEDVGGDFSATVGGNLNCKVGGNIAHEAGGMGEVHIKAGMKVIIEAGMQLSLVGPGGFIDIGPTGISIQGTLVNINSGGSAGSGGGCSPAAAQEAEPAEPTQPDMAHTSNPGTKSNKD